MTYKEQEPSHKRYYKLNFSVSATPKQSPVEHDLEKPKAEQILGETPVSYTWKSNDGYLELTAQAIYNNQNILTTIKLEIADFTSDPKKPIYKGVSFPKIENGATIQLKSSGNFTVSGYMKLTMPSAYPDDVLLFLNLRYGNENKIKHVEGGACLIKLEHPNLAR
ncbi:hypothetical protein QUA41_03400 [Microcoleus sp. Pol11C1]|uniref:hypothetical protein n=1 Tax=unclassified Microcoleus TaxID=2642155 RepID=UPI002FD08266